MNVGAWTIRTLIVAVLLLLLMPMGIVSASGSWNEGAFTWGEEEVVVSDTSAQQQCYTADVSVVGVGPLPQSARVCIFERPDFRYAIYYKNIPNWYGGSYTERHFLIAFGSD